MLLFLRFTVAHEFHQFWDLPLLVVGLDVFSGWKGKQNIGETFPKKKPTSNESAANEEVWKAPMRSQLFEIALHSLGPVHSVDVEGDQWEAVHFPQQSFQFAGTRQA